MANVSECAGKEELTLPPPPSKRDIFPVGRTIWLASEEKGNFVRWLLGGGERIGDGLSKEGLKKLCHNVYVPLS